MKNFDKFLYHKEITERDNFGKTYAWYLVHKEHRNGVHFHGMTRDKTSNLYAQDCNHFGFITLGIEMHSKNPLWSEQTPISNCWVTGGDCYCDGSSMAAREELGHISPDGKDDDYIWLTLEDWYKCKFEKDCEE